MSLDDDSEIAPEWAERWNVLRQRIGTQAQRRGGKLVITGALTYDLVPPGSGVQITVVALEAESAQVIVEGARLAALWALDDADPNNTLENLVMAVMDGNVKLGYEVVAGPAKGTAGGWLVERWQRR
jgi:hypothetical protein